MRAKPSLAASLAFCLMIQAAPTWAELTPENIKTLCKMEGNDSCDGAPCRAAYAKFLGKPKTLMMRVIGGEPSPFSPYSEMDQHPKSALRFLIHNVEWVSRGIAKRRQMKCYLRGDTVVDVGMME